VKSKIGFILFLVISIVVCCPKGRAQQLQQLIKQADSLSANGQLFKANRLYHKLAYVSDSANLVYMHKRLAATFAELDSFEYAQYYYTLLIDEDDDSMSTHWLFEAFSNGLKANNVEPLLKLLQRVEPNNLSSAEKVRFVFYNGLIQLKRHEVDAAITSFRQLNPFIQAKDSLALAHIINDYQKHALVRVKKAQVLSLVFPGAGQLYLGKPKSALNSVILNGALITGLVFTAIHYTVLDGVLFWVLPINHYYIGGAKAAGELAVQKQKELDHHYYNAFVKQISGMNFSLQ
jgi:TM2 domain-containing membrane protein YozV